MEKKQYIKITEPGYNNGYIIPVGEAKSELDVMMGNAVEGDEPQSYTFTVVFMTEDELKSLPEFEGF
jgi:hypothetical protein